MANINQLSTLSTLQGGDLLAVWSTNNGDSRKSSITTLMNYVNANVTTVTQNTQYASPAATGFSITVNTGNVWLLMTPVSTYAAGSVVLPAGASDKDTVTVNCTQIVTSLTVSSGATVVGAPTTLAANDFFTMRYDGATTSWYRVG
jgi:hypothetical protein